MFAQTRRVICDAVWCSRSYLYLNWEGDYFKKMDCSMVGYTTGETLLDWTVWLRTNLKVTVNRHRLLDSMYYLSYDKTKGRKISVTEYLPIILELLRRALRSLYIIEYTGSQYVSHWITNWIKYWSINIHYLL